MLRSQLGQTVAPVVFVGITTAASLQLSAQRPTGRERSPGAAECVGSPASLAARLGRRSKGQAHALPISPVSSNRAKVVETLIVEI